MRPHRRLRLLLAVLCLPLVAACGGSGGGGGGGSDDPNPAAAMPANVAAYFEASVRPEDDQASAIKSLTSKFGVPDPGKAIIDAINDDSDGSDVSYEKDIKPWLGRRAGVAVTNFSDDPPYLAAVGVKDEDAAKAFIKDSAKRDKDPTRTYKDTTYVVDDDTLAGVAGDYILIADDEREFKAFVDHVEAGKDSLDDEKRYGDAVGELPDDRIGTFYVSAAPALTALKRDPEVASNGGTALIDKFYGGLQSIAGAVTPYDDRGALEVRVKTDGTDRNDLLLGSGKAPSIVRETPADAIGVYGIADVGGTYKRAFDAFAGAFGGAALQSQLQSQYGIDLNKDVFSWLGDSAVFVRGSTPKDLNGALMIDAKDEAAATAALPKFIALAQQQGGLPIRATRLNGADQAWQVTFPTGLAETTAYVARRGTRVVIGLGEEATRMGLQPSASLDASGGYDRAKQAAGGLDPNVVLDVQKLLAVVDSASASDPDYQEAKPYLEKLGLFVGGLKRDGDALLFRSALTVE